MNPWSLGYRSLTLAHRFVLGAVINFSILLLLIPLAWLREQSVFWTNAGGWSIWFRGFVEASFFPLFLLEFMLIAIFSGVCAQLLSRRSADGNVVLAVLLLLYVLFLFIIVIIAANNLENLIAGRPLHWHAD